MVKVTQLRITGAPYASAVRAAPCPVIYASQNEEGMASAL